MKSFVVIGMGRFGSALAIELTSLGHEVLAVDENEEAITRVADHVTHAVIGDAKDENVIRSIGVRNFDCAVVAIAGDIQDSVLVTLMLKDLGVKKVIAQAQSLMHQRVLERIGADQVVFPELDMGQRVAQTLAGT
ncbi:MAG: TrkA family potassium uptake protein, partial [Clostridia bacterium]